LNFNFVVTLKSWLCISDVLSEAPGGAFSPPLRPAPLTYNVVLQGILQCFCHLLKNETGFYAVNKAKPRALKEGREGVCQDLKHKFKSQQYSSY
jgi:hypothetical protein